jgi:hypothetical protein
VTCLRQSYYESENNDKETWPKQSPLVRFCLYILRGAETPKVHDFAEIFANIAGQVKKEPTQR